MEEEKKKEDLPTFLDVKGIAKFLNLSTARVYQIKATDQSFPFHKVGEKLLFERNEVYQWVMSH